MSVSEAIKERTSIRAYLDKTVSKELILNILNEAKYAPSGGNLQPWNVYVLHGETLKIFLNIIQLSQPGIPEYNVYPPKLKLKYHKRRKQVAIDMYKSLNIKYKDKMKRYEWFKKNWKFFDAPVGLLFTIDTQMEPPQYSDLGMYLQNIMLLCKQYGLDTCAQEAWAVWSSLVHKVLNIPKHELLFCGMAVGYADKTANVNQFSTQRENLDNFVKHEHNISHMKQILSQIKNPKSKL